MCHHDKVTGVPFEGKPQENERTGRLFMHLLSNFSVVVITGGRECLSKQGILKASKQKIFVFTIVKYTFSHLYTALPSSKELRVV